LPIGAMMSMTRPVMFSSALMSRSSTSASSGKSGVRFSNRILFFAFSGGSPLTLSTFTSAKYRSPSLGVRISPSIVSPVCRLNRRICDGEM
jgi:hypothetical protein